MRRPRRNHSLAINAKVASGAIDGYASRPALRSAPEPDYRLRYEPVASAADAFTTEREL
jgi:hypothetical protein